MKNIIVVGAGPAGMMAAYSAAKADPENRVLLYDKNEKTGKKLFITGKGRCNITNASDIEVIMNNIVSNRDFMYSAIYTFDNNALMTFIEEHGTPLKVERGNRVFPVSDHSSDILKAMNKALDEAGVIANLNKRINQIIVSESTAKGIILDDGKRERADAIILATGGMSYPSTGSSGDGIKFAEKEGHKIVECLPALVPVETREEYIKELQGLSLKNVSLRIYDGKKEIYNEFGEMLFTHYGVSGPLVLTASSVIGRRLQKKELNACIDLKPALSEKQLDDRILRIIQDNINKQFKNSLNGLLPGKMLPVYAKLTGIDGEKQMNSLTKEERRRMVELLKAFPMTLVSLRGMDEAIITSGGVNVKEVNPSTMESKLIKNLYFAGEMLDLDAFTGGYNLQIAWSTGYLAGLSAGQ